MLQPAELVAHLQALAVQFDQTAVLLAVQLLDLQRAETETEELFIRSFVLFNVVRCCYSVRPLPLMKGCR